MPDISIDEAVNQTCQALMTGDVTRVISDFTPEALGAVVALAAGISSVPSLIGFEVRSHDTAGDEHLFHIAFKTSEGEVGARATWIEIDGFWKITALTLEGL